MTNEHWDNKDTEGTDWYNNFINLYNNVYNNFQQSFPLVKLLPKRVKDKSRITKGLKIDTYEHHSLFKLSLRNCDPLVKIKYKHYKIISLISGTFRK